MSALTRITTEFAVEEDRIRLSGERAGAPPVAIWMTRRMLCRLIPVLRQWLEKENGNLLRSDTLQGLAQHSARANQKPQPPVRVSTDAESWLVRTMDISSNSQAVSLTFKAEQGQLASLVLTAEPLRQWLNILHSIWVKAEWSGDVWPDWINEVPQLAQESVVVH